MWKWAVIAIFALLWILSSKPSFAVTQGYYPDGHTMLSNCLQYTKRVRGKVFYNSEKAGWCMGFVQGIESWHLLSATYGRVRNGPALEDSRQLYCLPDNITLGEVAHTIVLYLQNNPTKLKLPAVILSIDALMKKYPCSS